MAEGLREKSNSVLESPQFWNITSLLIGIISALGQYLIPEVNRLHPVFAGLIVGLLTRNIGFLSQLITQTGDINTEVKKKIEILREIKINLLDRRELTRSMGRRIIEKYREGIEETKHGFQVSAEDWAFSCLREFWGLLREEQKSRRDQDRQAIVVNVTHSTAIELWETGKGSQESLAPQKAFVDEGGIIRRIFVGRDLAPSSSYLRVMKDMKKKKIDVYYASRKKTGCSNFDYDFTWVPDLGIVLKWHSDSVGDSVRSCEIVDKVEKEDMDRWDSIIKAAE